jgi:CRP/FNR family transcriptional regulator, cyclic AMP receptor protein
MTTLSFTPTGRADLAVVPATRGVAQLITKPATLHDPWKRKHPDVKLTLLGRHYLFRQLTPMHLDRLCSLVVTKVIKRGSTIFAKGDTGSSLFTICKGNVKISVPSVDGHHAIVNLLKKGDIFGETVLLDGRPRSADAIAITDCDLFVIERRDFLPLLRELPEIALHLVEILCARLQQMTDQATNLMFLRLPSRLAKALLRLAEDDTKGRGRTVSATQNDLANIIGMTRESANRQLRDWERKKWLRLGRGEIIILFPDKLTAIADSDSGDCC